MSPLLLEWLLLEWLLLERLTSSIAGSKVTIKSFSLHFKLLGIVVVLLGPSNIWMLHQLWLWSWPSLAIETATTLSRLRVGREAGGRHAHCHGGFGHAVECVATGFRRWAFLDEIAEDGGRSQDSEIHFIHCLLIQD